LYGLAFWGQHLLFASHGAFTFLPTTL
jgi:hypothetical protein